MSVSAHNPTEKVLCGVCYVQWPIREMANLTDKNDHGWYICPDCITKLWNAARPPLVETPPMFSADADKLTTALAVFVGSMAVIREMLPEDTPNSLLTAMDREIANARRIYSSDV